MKSTENTTGAGRQEYRYNVFGVSARFAATRVRLFFALLGDEARHVARVLRDLGRRPSLKLAWRYFEQGLGRNSQRFASGFRIPAAELDNLPLLGQSRRTIRAVSRVSSQRDLELVDYADLSRQVDAAYNEALEKDTFAAVADCQWFTESLGWAAAVHARRNNDGCLKDVAIEKPIEPIMHFGIGMYALCSIGERQVSRVRQAIDRWSDEHFKFLSYDGLGLLLAFADSGIRNLHEVFQVFKIPTFRPPDENNVTQYVEHLEEAADHMLCRGYGRGLYFMSGSLNSAVKAVQRAADAYGLRLEWLTEGAAFAFAMVNSPHPAEVIRAYEYVPEQDQPAVIEGIGDNLFFNEFTFAGFLDKLERRYGRTLATEKARGKAGLLSQERPRSPRGAAVTESLPAPETAPAGVQVTAMLRLARAMHAYAAQR